MIRDPAGTDPGSPATATVGSRRRRGGRPASRTRGPFRRGLQAIRRAHLYAGLFLTPWVLLYGVTGFLFNHPGAFPDREVRRTGPEGLAGTPLEGFPTAERLAPRVVAALNAREGREAYRLVEPGAAAYSRPIVATATGPGVEHRVRFDPDAGRAEVFSTPQAAPRTPPVPLPLDDPPAARLDVGTRALLGRLGLPFEAITVRNPPELLCYVESGGRWLRLAYNLQTGAATLAAPDEPAAHPSPRRFLTGLHTAATYPARTGPRWFWALGVDAMAIAMVGWGLTGLVMWWQMRPLRRGGLIVLALSLLAAGLLAGGMSASIRP